MARGLVRRQPNFALMTETFRQFVLSSPSSAEVEALEGQFSSTWDRIRWPFLTVLIVGAVFFYVTQREAFNTALGLLTATATVVPAVAKMAGLLWRAPFGLTRCGRARVAAIKSSIIDPEIIDGNPWPLRHRPA